MEMKTIKIILSILLIYSLSSCRLNRELEHKVVFQLVTKQVAGKHVLRRGQVYTTDSLLNVKELVIYNYFGDDTSRAQLALTTNLERLYVYNSTKEEFDAVVDIAKEFRHLKYLKFGTCKSISDSIGKLKHLKGIEFSRYIDTILPEGIGNCKNLEYLTMCDHDWGSGIKSLPVSLSKLKKLRYINLWNTQMVEFPTIVKDIENLEILDIGYTKIRKLNIEILQKSNIKVLSMYSLYIFDIPLQRLKSSNLRVIQTNDFFYERKFKWQNFKKKQYLRGVDSYNE